MVNNNSKKYPYKNSDYNACLFNLCGIFSITQIKIFIKYFYVNKKVIIHEVGAKACFLSKK